MKSSLKKKTVTTKNRTQPTLSRAKKKNAMLEASKSSSALVSKLQRLLFKPKVKAKEFASSIDALEQKHGDVVYVELLQLLTHLQFKPQQARQHWMAIVDLQKLMHKRLRSPVDVMVALVNYFVDVNRKLKCPKVVELKLFQETQASVYRDGLTGLYNYRYFREQLIKEVDRVERYSSPLSLVMVDIDYFKQYNDNNGHQAGNRTLVKVAKLLLATLRKSDMAIRYGGEEFALILPSTPKEGGLKLAGRVCRKIADHSFPYEANQPNKSLTVSVGVATYPSDGTNVEKLVRNADSAMYVAKSQGKKQVYGYGQNRRSYKRIEATIEGSFCVLQAEYHPFTTVNISEGGLLLTANKKLSVDSLLDIKLVLPEDDTKISCSGRVVRLEEVGKDNYKAGIRIMDMPQKDRRKINKFIRAWIKG